uniref:Uncharacterized protein n=1 Tax=Tetranychus urticae TaxID=32264 RepID=T1K3E8_TETUR
MEQEGGKKLCKDEWETLKNLDQQWKVNGAKFVITYCLSGYKFFVPVVSP